MKHRKSIIVGIISGLAAILVIHLNLNFWLTLLLISMIVYIFATLISHYHSR